MQNKEKLLRSAGVVGAASILTYYTLHPSWPTVDKIFVLSIFIFLSIGQAKELIRRFLPFVILLLSYESLRSIATKINDNVNYERMIRADELLFGRLPTARLQDWLWGGAVTWAEVSLYLVYMLHFVLPWVLGVVIWKKRDEYYWKYIGSLLVLSYAGFITFVLFPAAPPWLASEEGLIDPIRRISTDVWFAFGIEDSVSFYNKLSPNKVAAVPSLHAGYATLLAIYTTRLFKNSWAKLAWAYPVLIYFGSVYMGEHYVIDMIIGSLYATAAVYLVDSFDWLKLLKRLVSDRGINRNN